MGGKFFVVFPTLNFRRSKISKVNGHSTEHQLTLGICVSLCSKNSGFAIYSCVLIDFFDSMFEGDQHSISVRTIWNDLQHCDLRKTSVRTKTQAPGS